MSAEAATLDRRDQIATITLTRPDAANAIDSAMLAAVHGFITELADDSSVRVVIVTGSGRHFCAGADLREDRAQRQASRRNLGPLDLGVLPQPVIAAINGPALGGGCEISLTCDFRVMAEDARIGLPEILFGSLPLGGGTARLPRTVGLSAAKRMIMTGRPLTAAEAQRIGLVDETAAAGEVLRVAGDLAAELCSGPDYALRAAKTLLDASLTVDLPTALANERTIVKNMATPEERSAARKHAAATSSAYARIFGARWDR